MTFGGKEIVWAVVQHRWDGVLRHTGLRPRVHPDPSSFCETSGSARGLVQFDSSARGTLRTIPFRAVSPHPDPLPQGQGTARSAEWKADRYALFSTETMVHPLPKGEGRAEGKETTAPRSADVVASACGQRQQFHVPMYPRHCRRSLIPLSTLMPVSTLR